MYKSIAVIEYRSVAMGFSAADTMVKSAHVKLLRCEVVCPGRLVIVLTGLLSSVQAALDTAKSASFASWLVDTYFLGNPHEGLLAALAGENIKTAPAAVGILEGYSVSSIIGASDEMIKAAPVDIISIRLAKGMSGKAYSVISGEISAVDAAINHGEKILLRGGFLVSKAVIANPDPQVWEML